jgi:hypothetical protein
MTHNLVALVLLLSAAGGIAGARETLEQEKERLEADIAQLEAELAAIVVDPAYPLTADRIADLSQLVVQLQTFLRFLPNGALTDHRLPGAVARELAALNPIALEKFSAELQTATEDEQQSTERRQTALCQADEIQRQLGEARADLKSTLTALEQLATL